MTALAAPVLCLLPQRGIHRRVLLCIGLIVLLGTACVSTPPTAPARENGELGEEVLRLCTIRASSGFRQISRNRVLLTLTASRQYVIDTIGSCPDLDTAFRIGFDSWDRCLSAGDRIIIPPLFESRSPRAQRIPPPSCRVQRIYAWKPAVNTPPPGTP